MLLPRRSAQLGLGAACLILVSSIAVLIAGASDSPDPASAQNDQTVTPAAHKAPEIHNPAGVASAAGGLSQTIAVAPKL